MQATCLWQSWRTARPNILMPTLSSLTYLYSGECFCDSILANAASLDNPSRMQHALLRLSNPTCGGRSVLPLYKSIKANADSLYSRSSLHYLLHSSLMWLHGVLRRTSGSRTLGNAFTADELTTAQVKCILCREGIFPRWAEVRQGILVRRYIHRSINFLSNCGMPCSGGWGILADAHLAAVVESA
jgi:hypothetical protein